MQNAFPEIIAKLWREPAGALLAMPGLGRMN